MHNTVVLESVQPEIDQFAKDTRKLGFPWTNYAYASYINTQNTETPLPSVVLNSGLSELPRVTRRALIDKCGSTSDPLTRQILTRNMPISWHSRKGRLSNPEHLLSRDQQKTVREMSAVGLDGGVVVPIHTLGTGVAAIAFYAPDCADYVRDLPQRTLEQLFFRAHQFHDYLFPLLEKKVSGHISRLLSPREIECLAWSAKGKNSREIAIILSLSPDTIRDHLKNAARKLSAVTRAQAIAKALQLGLLSGNFL